MTTLRDIINKAYREAGITAVGETPDADQNAEGLGALNNLIVGMYDNEFGEEMQTVNYGINGLTNVYAQAEDQSGTIDSTFLPENTRLIMNVGAAATIFLPPNPRDGARFGINDIKGNFGTYNITIKGNGRFIENAPSVILNTNYTVSEWFYRSDIAAWTKVSDLAEDDPMPWPQAFDDYFITLLAFRLNPRYGAQTDQNMVDILKAAKKRFRAKYRQIKEMPSEDGLTILTLNPYSRNYLTF
jgi:hypothetical protein